MPQKPFITISFTMRQTNYHHMPNIAQFSTMKSRDTLRQEHHLIFGCFHKSNFIVNSCQVSKFNKTKHWKLSLSDHVRLNLTPNFEHLILIWSHLAKNDPFLLIFIIHRLNMPLFLSHLYLSLVERNAENGISMFFWEINITEKKATQNDIRSIKNCLNLHISSILIEKFT